jgi:hypothetical protein
MVRVRSRIPFIVKRSTVTFGLLLSDRIYEEPTRDRQIVKMLFGEQILTSVVNTLGSVIAQYSDASNNSGGRYASADFGGR